MLLPRHYSDLRDYLKPGKVLVIYGPRQVGKTTLVKNFLEGSGLKYRFDSGELLNIQNVLSSQDLLSLKEFVAGYDLIAIDEAHKIPNIGLNLKIIVDHFPNLKVIATGSSSFDLLGQLGEPLVGRKTTLRLYPLAQLELSKLFNQFELKENLQDYLIYGSYPEVLTATTRRDKQNLLDELVQGYIFKDIFELERVKGPRVLMNLLTLVAFQIGSEVSLSELAKKLGIDVKTVSRYLDLLEKSFILHSLRGFSRNLRKEVTRRSKYYFYDVGIRNAVISSYNSLDKRNDIGQLWENFLVMERLKKQEYENIHANNYFWRTWDQKEIDFVEERDGKLYGFEFKYKKDSFKKPKLFLETYPEGSVELINKGNFLKFVS